MSMGSGELEALLKIMRENGVVELITGEEHPMKLVLTPEAMELKPIRPMVAFATDEDADEDDRDARQQELWGDKDLYSDG